MNDRVQVILSLRNMRESIRNYLDVIKEGGFDLIHVVRFTIYALGEGPLRVSMVHDPKGNPNTYLGHEIASVNPFLTRDPALYQKIVNNMASAIEILFQVIRTQIFQTVRNATAHALVLEHVVGDAIVVSMNLIEQPFHAPIPRVKAPVF
jgi:hypothetical protein